MGYPMGVKMCENVKFLSIWGKDYTDIEKIHISNNIVFTVKRAIKETMYLVNLSSYVAGVV